MNQSRLKRIIIIWVTSIVVQTQLVIRVPTTGLPIRGDYMEATPPLVHLPTIETVDITA